MHNVSKFHENVTVHLISAPMPLFYPESSMYSKSVFYCPLYTITLPTLAATTKESAPEVLDEVYHKCLLAEIPKYAVISWKCYAASLILFFQWKSDGKTYISVLGVNMAQIQKKIFGFAWPLKKNSNRTPYVTKHLLFLQGIWLRPALLPYRWSWVVITSNYHNNQSDRWIFKK